MSFFRRIYRLFLIAAAIGLSILEVLIKRPRTRPLRAAWLRQIGQRLMRVTDTTLTTIGPLPMHGAVICNHLAYFDIVAQAVARPCVFVSKIELRKTPVVGWVSMMAGTVYVARGAGGSAAKAAQGMAKGFDEGLPVVFFPEGTTTSGEAMLPFRSGLLAQAIAADQPITASFVSYQLTPFDLARGKTVRDDIHWTTQTLLAHIWNFADLHGLHATLRFAPEPIAFSPAALANRKIAALEAFTAVQALSSQPLD